MKTMTCNQLGGACDKSLSAKTFEEIAKMSQAHGREMFEKGDEAHLMAQKKMTGLMNAPEAMKAWMETKRDEFDALPED